MLLCTSFGVGENSHFYDWRLDSLPPTSFVFGSDDHGYASIPLDRDGVAHSCTIIFLL